MCGIIGTSKVNISENLFSKAFILLFRRGPENQQIRNNNTVLFGHTRLSIVDLEIRSNQPFEYSSGGKTILITFNGEIYNYLSLKNDLINDGCNFETNSDTEVICAAYLKYGTKCFDLFEGMWSVAINDGDNIILSRDRVGKKPLFYSLDSTGNLYFSSSVKSVSILTNNELIDSKSVELYFALGFIPDSLTIYENIFKVKPGEVITFRKSQSNFRKDKIENSVLIESSNNLTVKELLQNAISKRLICDVPISTLMSGGIDSTIVTKYITTQLPKTEAFFVDFEDKVYSENAWATYLSSRNEINLIKVALDSKEIDKAFENYYSVFEEPFADYSGLPSISIFNIVSQKYKVVLTGDGGDELFYGYPHYFKKLVIFKLFFILKRLRNIKGFPKHLKTIVEGDRNNFESNYLRNHGVVTPNAANFIDNIFNNILKSKKSFSKSIIEYDREFYNLPEKYLTKIDRASMWSGVEVRSPFMDEILKNKVKQISPLKIFTPYSYKLYLKILFFDTFGLKYFLASKKGFTPPIQHLRDVHYKEDDFIKTKKYIKSVCESLYSQVQKISFSDLLNDKILFDRFFFFNEWLKKNGKLKKVIFVNDKNYHVNESK